jgi:hypothetical protein
MTTAQKQTDQEIFNETGIWEGWMQFDGMTCNAAFDVGYDAGESGDAMPENFKHAALVSAWKDGKRQYAEEN